MAPGMPDLRALVRDRRSSHARRFLDGFMFFRELRSSHRMREKIAESPGICHMTPRARRPASTPRPPRRKRLSPTKSAPRQDSAIDLRRVDRAARRRCRSWYGLQREHHRGPLRGRTSFCTILASTPRRSSALGVPCVFCSSAGRARPTSAGRDHEHFTHRGGTVVVRWG